MIHILYCFLCMALIFSSFNEGENPLPPPDSLNIATYNINYGNVNLPLVAETILRSRADVVALQETNEESEA